MTLGAVRCHAKYIALPNSTRFVQHVGIIKPNHNPSTNPNLKPNCNRKKINKTLAHETLRHRARAMAQMRVIWHG